MEHVYQSVLFQSTYPYANLLYDISKEEYAQKLLNAKALLGTGRIMSAFVWWDTEEGGKYWLAIHELWHKREF